MFRFKKKEKIQPINLNTNNDIDIEQFLKEAQQEEFCSKSGQGLTSNMFRSFLEALCKNVYHRY